MFLADSLPNNRTIPPEYTSEMEDEIIVELSENRVKEETEGEISYRPLTVNEKTMLRKTILQYQSEISKIEGDYASEKFKIEQQTEIKESQVIIYIPDNGRGGGQKPTMTEKELGLK